MNKLVCFMLCLVGSISGAQAASFPCSRAETHVERLICADSALSKLDDELTRAYRDALRNADHRQRMLADQRQWLTETRDACADAACLKTAYEARIEFLEADAVAKSVFSLKEGNAIVDSNLLKRSPKGVTAILAMYALQNGGDCDGPSGKVKCTLTDALNVGGQCSKEHLDLVRTWFKEGMPPMSGYSDDLHRNLERHHVLERICYETPGGATYQRRWDSIRMAVSGRRVTIIATVFWLARDNAGEQGYVSEYEMSDNTVTVLSHKRFE